MTETFAVTVAGLVHQYDDTQALAGVDLTVTPGEIFGVLGPNGGGKTTLFRILSTLLTPTGGTAHVCGHDVVAEARAVRSAIGVVFQSPSLDVALSVEENLMHQGHLYGLRGHVLKDRIAEVLAHFGLNDRARDRAGTLSGGLKRRVEIAKGLLHLPRILLLDEPSTGLDPGARQELWRHLADLRDTEHMTVVLTTHFMDEAARCDRLALIDRGALVALGTPDELTATIGGDIVTLDTVDPAVLQHKVAEQFGGDPFVLAGAVRIERDRGHEFIAQVVEAFPEDITGVHLGKPSLEDVFIHTTGRRFWDAPAESEAA